MSIWFGTRDYMQWVKAPAINMDSSKQGIFNQSSYLSGGAYIRRSWGSHKEYNLSWNLASRDQLRPIQDYADGIYGTGYIYWVNPFAMDVNLLPTYWAAPFLGALDGPILDGKDTRPEAVQTVSNPYGYPVQGAFYNVSADGIKPSVWIPCPPGYDLWVGVKGVAGTGGVVVATPTTGPYTIGTSTELAFGSVLDDIRVTDQFSSSNYTGVQISLGGIGTMTVTSITVQAIKTGEFPINGGFMSGQGHSGCMFAGQPTLTEYNAVMDKVGLSAKLVEVEAWQ